MPVSASTAAATPITLSVEVKGIGLSALEAQKLCKQIQSSLSYHFGVKEEDLIVEVYADEAAVEEKKPSPSEFADQAVAKAQGELDA